MSAHDAAPSPVSGREGGTTDDGVRATLLVLVQDVIAAQGHLTYGSASFVAQERMAAKLQGVARVLHELASDANEAMRVVPRSAAPSPVSGRAGGDDTVEQTFRRVIVRALRLHATAGEFMSLTSGECGGLLQLLGEVNPLAAALSPAGEREGGDT